MKKLLPFILILSGCYTAKKAEADMDKVKANHPLIAAKKCAEWYPVKPQVTVVTDTVYDFIELECPGETLPTIKHDTIFQDRIVKLQPGKQLVYLPGKVITKTVTVVDSSAHAVYALKLASCEADKEKYRTRAEKRQTVNIWLLIALLVSMAANFIKFRK